MQKLIIVLIYFVKSKIKKKKATKITFIWIHLLIDPLSHIKLLNELKKIVDIIWCMRISNYFILRQNN